MRRSFAQKHTIARKGVVWAVLSATGLLLMGGSVGASPVTAIGGAGAGSAAGLSGIVAVDGRYPAPPRRPGWRGISPGRAATIGAATAMGVAAGDALADTVTDAINCPTVIGQVWDPRLNAYVPQRQRVCNDGQ